MADVLHSLLADNMFTYTLEISVIEIKQSFLSLAEQMSLNTVILSATMC